VHVGLLIGLFLAPGDTAARPSRYPRRHCWRCRRPAFVVQVHGVHVGLILGFCTIDSLVLLHSPDAVTSFLRQQVRLYAVC